MWDWGTERPGGRGDQFSLSLGERGLGGSLREREQGISYWESGYVGALGGYATGNR